MPLDFGVGVLAITVVTMVTIPVTAIPLTWLLCVAKEKGRAKVMANEREKDPMVLHAGTAIPEICALGKNTTLFLEEDRIQGQPQATNWLIDTGASLSFLC